MPPRFDKHPDHKASLPRGATTVTPRAQDYAPLLIQRALANPTPQTLTPDVLLSLHQSHGNAFVRRLINRSTTKAEPAAPMTYGVQQSSAVSGRKSIYSTPQSVSVVQRKGPQVPQSKYDPAATRTHQKTHGDARLDSVQLWQGENAGDHAEIQIINAFEAAVGQYEEDKQPRLLSIRLNRAPCKNCADALAALLGDYPTLQIRVKASAITDATGLEVLRATPRLYFRFWTQEQVEESDLTNATDDIAGDRYDKVLKYFCKPFVPPKREAKRKGSKAKPPLKSNVAKKPKGQAKYLKTRREIKEILNTFVGQRFDRLTTARRAAMAALNKLYEYNYSSSMQYLNALFYAYHPDDALASAEDVFGEGIGQTWEELGLSKAELLAKAEEGEDMEDEEGEEAEEGGDMEDEKDPLLLS